MAEAPKPLSPQAQLIQMAWAHQISSLVRVAAQLKLADYLADGSHTAEELAQATATHAPSLYRVMRTLASLGLFTEDEHHRFSLTPLAEPLRCGVPGSVRTSVLAMTGDIFCKPMAQLLYSVQTGKTGFSKAFGEAIFDWLPKHPEEAAMFTDLMIGFHGPETAAVAAAYDFAGFETLADVGGATGNLLTTILARHPGPRGVLFDLPHNESAAAALIHSRGMGDRVSFEAGNFFAGVPSQYDVYMMSHIIHDWNEDQCLTILGNCLSAMKSTSRLLIIEMVLPPGDTPHPGKTTDIVMLTVPGGQERTEAEYRELLNKAGFNLARVVPTESAVSIVEAFPA
jgi:O-methyltransferase domain/Dimerisation domain